LSVVRKIGIKALKNDLSKYIRAVAAGETVLVTDRGHVVAQIAPPRISDHPLESNPLLAEDVRRGRIAPAANPPYLPGPKVHVAPFDAVMRELRDDRDRR
jgi:prevent-host-death family protein